MILDNDMADWMKDETWDRITVNESDGMVFYGHDDEETGYTTWYGKDGIADSQTPIPKDEDEDYW